MTDKKKKVWTSEDLPGLPRVVEMLNGVEPKYKPFGKYSTDKYASLRRENPVALSRKGDCHLVCRLLFLRLGFGQIVGLKKSLDSETVAHYYLEIDNFDFDLGGYKPRGWMRKRFKCDYFESVTLEQLDGAIAMSFRHEPEARRIVEPRYTKYITKRIGAWSAKQNWIG